MSAIFKGIRKNRIYRILEAAAIPILSVITGIYFKVWENSGFWIVGFMAVVVAILFDRIPRRMSLLRFLLLFTLPMIAMINGKIGVNQYLLVDAGIFLTAINIIDYFKEIR